MYACHSGCQFEVSVLYLKHPVGRRVLFGALYLSEGAPIGFVWIALPTLLRDRDAYARFEFFFNQSA
jgi:hypothetical protein